MSADHNLETRVLIFVTDDDHERHGAALQVALKASVPPTYVGRPTH